MRTVPRTPRRLFGLLALGLLFGCTPNVGPAQPVVTPAPGAPLGGTSQPPTGTQTPAPDGSQTAVSFQTQVAPLLKDRCASCHGTAVAADGLILFDAAGKARQGEIKTRIASIIATVESGKMPQGGPRFTPSEVDLLQDWKAEGAPNN